MYVFRFQNNSLKINYCTTGHYIIPWQQDGKGPAGQTLVTKHWQARKIVSGDHQGAASGNAAVPNTAHNEVNLGPQAAPPQSATINSLQSPPVASMHGVSSYTPFAPPIVPTQINGVNPASQALPLDQNMATAAINTSQINSLNGMLQDGEASFPRSLFEPSPQQNGIKQLGLHLNDSLPLPLKRKSGGVNMFVID